MTNYQQRTFKQHRIRAIEDSIFTLTGKNKENGYGQIRMKWTDENNPRITCFTGIERNGRKIVYEFRTKPHFFMEILRSLRQYAQTGKEGQSNWEYHKDVYDQNNNRTKDKVYVSTLEVGRDSNGYCFMAVYNKNEPELRVPCIFKMDAYTKFVDRDGNLIDRGEASRAVCLSWVALVESTAEILFYEGATQKAQVRQKDRDAASSNQGNVQRNNNQGESNRPYDNRPNQSNLDTSSESSSTEDDYDDDIPF